MKSSRTSRQNRCEDRGRAAENLVSSSHTREQQSRDPVAQVRHQQIEQIPIALVGTGCAQGRVQFGRKYLR